MSNTEMMNILKSLSAGQQSIIKNLESIDTRVKALETDNSTEESSPSAWQTAGVKKPKAPPPFKPEEFMKGVMKCRSDNKMWSLLQLAYRVKPSSFEVVGEPHTNEKGDELYVSVNVNHEDESHCGTGKPYNTLHLYGTMRGWTGFKATRATLFLYGEIVDLGVFLAPPKPFTMKDYLCPSAETYK